MLTITEKGDLLILTLSVKAGARHNRVVGEKDTTLSVEVTAPPVEGKANKAVCTLIARSLDVAPTRVAIVSGEKSRLKRVSISGVSRADIERLGGTSTRT